MWFLLFVYPWVVTLWLNSLVSQYDLNFPPCWRADLFKSELQDFCFWWSKPCICILCVDVHPRHTRTECRQLKNWLFYCFRSLSLPEYLCHCRTSLQYPKTRTRECTAWPTTLKLDCDCCLDTGSIKLIRWGCWLILGIRCSPKCICILQMRF